MRKSLSLLLSVLLLLLPINSMCSAETCCKNSKSKSDSVNNKTIIISGDTMPNLVINNNVHAQAQSKSKAVAIAGKSKGIQLLKIAFKVITAYLTVKYVRSIINNDKSWIKLFMQNKDVFMTHLQQAFAKAIDAMKSTDQQLDKSESNNVVCEAQNQFVSSLQQYLGTAFCALENTDQQLASLDTKDGTLEWKSKHNDNKTFMGDVKKLWFGVEEFFKEFFPVEKQKLYAVRRLS